MGSASAEVIYSGAYNYTNTNVVVVSGNVAAFLCSDLASGVTGEITYVDGGMNITAAGTVED